VNRATVMMWRRALRDADQCMFYRDENDPEELLDTIEKRMKAAPFRMQEPMNYCMVKIAVDLPKVAQARDCNRQQAGSS
jgi:hypothetical protein